MVLGRGVGATPHPEGFSAAPLAKCLPFPLRRWYQALRGLSLCAQAGLKGPVCPRCPQTSPELRICGDICPSPCLFLFLPSEHRCSCLNRTYFQDDSWGGCGWEARPTPRARLRCNLSALLALGCGAFHLEVPALGSSLKGPSLPRPLLQFPFGSSGLVLPNLQLLLVRQEGGNLPGQPSVFMRCFTSCSHGSLASGAIG